MFRIHTIVSVPTNIKIYQKPLDCFRTRMWMDGTLKWNLLTSVFVMLHSAFTRSIAYRHCTTSIHSKWRVEKKKGFKMTQFVSWSDTEWIRKARGQIDDTCNVKHTCQQQSASTYFFFYLETLRCSESWRWGILCKCPNTWKICLCLDG